MKTISLLQPFASLLACGAKRIETRSFPVRYRGALAIHASARWERDYLELCFEEPFKSTLAAAGFTTPHDLPLGAVLATCELYDCRSTCSKGYGAPAWIGQLSKQERAFGNYAPARYGWFLRNVQPFAEPVPAKGKRGLWLWEPGGVVAVETALPQAALELG